MVKLLNDTIRMKFNVDQTIQYANQGCLDHPTGLDEWKEM